ncbi:uncharacterized protein [Prorops nasuta]
MMGTFPDCDVKLCDFEISRVILEGADVREILGTPDYVAPEILHYEPITLAADMWSLGVTTYVLLTGFSPFGGETDQETFQNISLGEVDFPEELFDDISPQAKDFVAKLLLLDPSERMTARQSLRHDWLRAAPTQASPHLRRYLSKSREVLLERVVSRENLRRAALLQSENAASQASLNENHHHHRHHHHHQQCQGLQDCLLSQSEMCLNNCMSESLASSTTDSQTSLNSSRTSLSCASQSCLLNKEQTQGLLDRAYSRSQANLDQNTTRRGLLSRIRSLNRIQSHGCLLNNSGGGSSNGQPVAGATQLSRNTSMNPLISRSREKLYGLKSLSKSQGVLDICRSLESLKRKKNLWRSGNNVRTDTLFGSRFIDQEDEKSEFKVEEKRKQSSESEDRICLENAKNPTPEDREESVPESLQPSQGHSVNICERLECLERGKNIPASGTDKKLQESLDDGRSDFEVDKEEPLKRRSSKEVDKAQRARGEGLLSLPSADNNLDSLKSLDSDTLTEESEGSSTKEFLEDPDLEKNGIKGKGMAIYGGIRSYCRRKDSSASSDSNDSSENVAAVVAEEDQEREPEERSSESESEEPKYTVAQLVSAFNKHQEIASRSSLEAIMTEKKINQVTCFPTGPKALRLFIPDIDITTESGSSSCIVRRKTSYKPRKNWEELRRRNERNEGLLCKVFSEDPSIIGVQEARTMHLQSANDNTPILSPPSLHHHPEDTSGEMDSWTRIDKALGRRDSKSDVEIDEKYKQCVMGANGSADKKSILDRCYQGINDEVSSITDKKLKQQPYQNSLTISDKSLNSPEVKATVSDKRSVKHLQSDKVSSGEGTNNAFLGHCGAPFQQQQLRRTKDVAGGVFAGNPTCRANGNSSSGMHPKISCNTENAVNLKDILQRVDHFQNTPRENMEKLRKRTSIAKIIVNDNMVFETQDLDPEAASASTEKRTESDNPSLASEDKLNLTVPATLLIRSTSMSSSDSSCPPTPPSSVHSDLAMSWDDVQERQDINQVCSKTAKKVHSEQSRANIEDKRIWGRVCTGSYTRAMERFGGKNTEIPAATKKSIFLNVPPKFVEKRRKSPTASPKTC